jgi:cytochrome oxidase Cu insertion factor (SCO1/SenC/PrrC family)
MTLPTPVRPRSRTPLVLIVLISLAPVLAAVVAYFNPDWRPDGSVAYGTLIEPQRPIPASTVLQATTLDGKPFDVASLKGKWLLITADGGDCQDACARKLFILRNSHASQGKNVERLARVWFITDDAPIPERVLEAYKGTVMLRVQPEQLKAFLLAESASVSTSTGTTSAGVVTPSGTATALSSAAAKALAEPMWIIDPHANLMMQYPANAEPEKVRTDIRKLIYHSRIG